jgi:tRNA threonylcarbamoyladenosine biosynthesis protein TsaE
LSKKGVAKKFTSLSLPEIKILASRLAKSLTNKDYVIGLTGDLGAGKTTFAKAFAKSLGIKHRIKSPTFVISCQYPFGKGRHLYHFDFYRLNHSKQLKAIGFPEILSGKNRLVLIEWADKFPSLAKQCDIIINFKIAGESSRHVTIV